VALVDRSCGLGFRTKVAKKTIQVLGQDYDMPETKPMEFCPKPRDQKEFLRYQQYLAAMN